MEIERLEKEADDNRRKTVIFENPMAERKGRKGNRTKQVVTEVEMTSVTVEGQQEADEDSEVRLSVVFQSGSRDSEVHADMSENPMHGPA